MCGICGIVDYKNKIKNKDIKKLLGSIRHRGPDDKGIYIENSENYSLALGHTRLSILDLSSKAHQPMGLNLKTGSIIFIDKNLENADIIISYNGEIYNFLEIKEKYKLKTETKSDTEIILKLYNKLGFACVKEFNGMWAFCIYDKRKNILFFSRDRLGKKPLYYFWNKNKFIFCSELKGILELLKINNIESIDKNSLEFYFSLGFIPAPYSIFKNVYKLEARQNLILNLKTKEISKFSYWDISDYEPIKKKSLLIEKAKELLESSTKLRLRSDVPIGSFLSGGLDSSTITAIAKKFLQKDKLYTFSIGFEGKYDESKYILIVSKHLKTIHNHSYFNKEDFENIKDKYSYIYDEPFADPSGFPTYKLCSLARKYVKVALSGDGGDEIFGGYKFYIYLKQLSILNFFPKFLLKILYKFSENKILFNYKNYIIYNSIKYLLDNDLNNILKIKFYILNDWIKEKLKICLEKSKGNLIETFRIFDLLYRTLPDNFLVKIDRASMANSLEVRSPFLDYRFVEFSQQIPTEYKVSFFKGKLLLREIIKNYLPKEILKRGKQGFEPPLEKWLLENKSKNLLNKGLDILNILNLNSFYKLYKEVFLKYDNRLFNIYKIRLFIFYNWWKKWISIP